MRSRWAVFLSGRGSNAQAAFEELHHLDIRLCVSSRKSALGLGKARRSSVPRLILDKNVDWNDLDSKLRLLKINKIMLLGFMKILPADFCAKWESAIWNLHPSLLPEFKGADAIERSYEKGWAMGISIHEVISEMDAGKIIQQKSICEQAKQKYAKLEEAQQDISRTEQMSVRRFMVKGNEDLRFLRRLERAKV